MDILKPLVSLPKFIKYIALFILCILFITLNTLFHPETQTGPFGIGLPAPMKMFTIESGNFSILHPSSWIANETKYGNHGDESVIAGIAVPGRSYPSVFIYKKFLLNNNVDEIVNLDMLEAKKQPNFVECSINPFSNSKYNGLVLEYSWISAPLLFSETTIRRQDYYLLFKDHVYIISLRQEKDQWIKVEDIFRTMLDSVIIR
jgi:hypothetical protein